MESLTTEQEYQQMRAILKEKQWGPVLAAEARLDFRRWEMRGNATRVEFLGVARWLTTSARCALLVAAMQTLLIPVS
jgi:hypothetical protein